MALNRKIAYIDLTSGTIETKPIPLEIRRKYLGGRGLDAYLLYNHTEAGVEAPSPDNALLISAGILGGTLASATARTPFRCWSNSSCRRTTSNTART